MYVCVCVTTKQATQLKKNLRPQLLDNLIQRCLSFLKHRGQKLFRLVIPVHKVGWPRNGCPPLLLYWKRQVDLSRLQVPWDQLGFSHPTLASPESSGFTCHPVLVPRLRADEWPARTSRCSQSITTLPDLASESECHTLASSWPSLSFFEPTKWPCKPNGSAARNVQWFNLKWIWLTWHCGNTKKHATFWTLERCSTFPPSAWTALSLRYIAVIWMVMYGSSWSSGCSIWKQTVGLSKVVKWCQMIWILLSQKRWKCSFCFCPQAESTESKPLN